MLDLCIKIQFLKIFLAWKNSAVGQCVGRALKIKAQMLSTNSFAFISDQENKISAWRKTDCTSTFNSVLTFLWVGETQWQHTVTIWLSEHKKGENPAQLYNIIILFHVAVTVVRFGVCICAWTEGRVSKHRKLEQASRGLPARHHLLKRKAQIHWCFVPTPPRHPSNPLTNCKAAGHKYTGMFLWNPLIKCLYLFLRPHIHCRLTNEGMVITREKA